MEFGWFGLVWLGWIGVVHLVYEHMISNKTPNNSVLLVNVFPHFR
jgi:hypothetical protein